MIETNELLTLLLAAGLWMFLFLNRFRVKQLPGFNIFSIALALLTSGWLLSILEGYLLPSVCNLLEHILYTAASILFALWSYRICSNRKVSE